ncbi:MAG: peptidylprolyl isomerase, partial [Saccharospirillaceae bacterium]|nr:peptidylprolyl isomerase [Saccharospirillaceae bacterium]
FGDIVFELNAQRAPKTVANFKKYIQTGFYKNVVFHRVISNFMIQGGGFTSKMEKKTATFKVENESISGLPNIKGSIAMARTTAPHSSSSKCFINVQDNASIDSKSADHFGYTVFGQVIKGMDVVEKIKMLKTQKITPPFIGGITHHNSPVEAVIIEKIYFKGAKPKMGAVETTVTAVATQTKQTTEKMVIESSKPVGKNESGFVTLLFSLIAFLFVSFRRVLSKCSKCINCKKSEEP